MKPIPLKDSYDITIAHTAIEATATSGEIPIAGCSAVAIEYTEGGTVNNRSGALTVTASLDDGTNYRAYNMILSNAANTNSQDYTRVASVTRASAGTDIFWLDPATLGAITHIKIVVTITDGAAPTGNFTVKVTRVA